MSRPTSVDGRCQIRCIYISFAGFLGLRGHHQLVLERDNTKVRRAWKWGKVLQEGLGRAAHGVRKAHDVRRVRW